MNNIITLNYLIQGDNSFDVLPIDIGKNKTIGHIMAEIKKANPQTFGDIDVKNIKLWKVNIPLPEVSSPNQSTTKLALLESSNDIDIAQELGGMKLQSKSKKISSIFDENIDDTYVHIIAERSKHDSKFESQDIIMDKILHNTETIKENLEDLRAKLNSLQKVVFQLHEDTVPRLFIILPEDHAWDFKADILFSRSYRLYFLCEHKQILENGVEHSEVHLADHVGYKLHHPRQFMKKYGSYIMKIMPYIKMAIHLAKSGLELAPFIGHTISMLGTFSEEICDKAILATDPVINDEYIHRALQMCVGIERLIKVSSNYPDSGSVGRPDSRALHEFIHGIDPNNTLGHLQRVLSNDNILWVCKAHANTCYADDTINEIQRISISMKEKVFFNRDTSELRIEELDRISLATLSHQLKPHLPKIPLLKLSFTKINKSNHFLFDLLDIDFKALLDSAKTVRTLWFTDCTFQPNMLKSVTLYTLNELRLDGINIGPDGAHILADSLKRTLLSELYLYGSGIGDNGAKALAKSLTKNSTLTQLNLYVSSIGDNGALALAKYLKKNSTLTKLNLGVNSIGDIGAKALADTLNQNSTLTQLDLEYNSIGDNGARDLADSLKKNSTLTQLSLYNNRIGEKGGIALADSLMCNSTLNKLNLEYNRIGDNGAVALACSLKCNFTLTQLNIKYNEIDDAKKCDFDMIKRQDLELSL